jgi:hypothetical protein
LDFSGHKLGWGPIALNPLSLERYRSDKAQADERPWNTKDAKGRENHERRTATSPTDALIALGSMTQNLLIISLVLFSRFSRPFASFVFQTFFASSAFAHIATRTTKAAMPHLSMHRGFPIFQLTDCPVT